MIVIISFEYIRIKQDFSEKMLFEVYAKRKNIKGNRALIECLRRKKKS